MIKGYESGFWSEGVPLANWIPAVYKQLSLSSIIDIKKRIVGELQCARDLKCQPKTHQFYKDKEAAHRAIQRAKEKHTINVSIDQLYGLIVSVNQGSADQANSGGSTRLESVHTPWLTHKIRSFINENLVSTNTTYQKKSTDGQRERVHTECGNKGGGSNASSNNKGGGSNASSNKGRGINASPQEFDWLEDVEMEKGDGDNVLSSKDGLC